MSSLASTEFAASQYALMTSLCVLPGSLLAGASGFVIERTGFQDFFIGTSLIGIPVVLLALFVWRNHPTVTQQLGWFTEGFDTRDLKEAKKLLEELTA